MGDERVGILHVMASEQDASFDADSAVGRYWLLHCTGFEVDGPHAPLGVVEEVVPDTDIGDVLVVRRKTPVPPRLVEVRAERVASIHPWEERIVLRGKRATPAPAAAVPAPAPTPRPARDRRLGAAAAAYAAGVRSRATPKAKTAGSHSARAARAGGAAVRRAGIALLALVAVAAAAVATFVRRYWPVVRATVAGYGRDAKQLTRAYAHEARRAVHHQRVTLVRDARHLPRAYAHETRRAVHDERVALAAWAKDVRATRPRPALPSVRRTRPERAAANGDGPDAETAENTVEDRRHAAS